MVDVPGQRVTTWRRWPRATSSVAMLVITSPVGATSGAKWGHRTRRFTARASASPRPDGRPRPSAFGGLRPTGSCRRARARRRTSAVAIGPRRSRVSNMAVGPTRDVVRVDQQPGVADDLGQRGGVRRDHRATVAHGLEHRQAEPLVPGRERQRGRVARTASRGRRVGTCPSRRTRSRRPSASTRSSTAALHRVRPVGEHEQRVGTLGGQPPRTPARA